MALNYAYWGDKNNAFLLFEKAYQQHSTWLIELKSLPDVDSLRSDPRFADLLRRIGFPQ